MTQMIEDQPDLQIQTASQRIPWYRPAIPREQLKTLNARSDWKGFRQAGGHLGLLACTGTAAVLSAGRIPWWSTLLILFFHGTCYAFLLNGFHELVHGTVFKTKKLNTIFLNLFSFLAKFNPVLFWASHTEHHKYTLHPPRDLEVVLPTAFTLKGFLQTTLGDPRGLWVGLKGHIRTARGKLEGEWEHALFPESAPERKNQLMRWSRIILVGHLGIIVAGVALGAFVDPRLYLIPVVTTLATNYGGWLIFLLNNTQHVGLADNVPDYRLCCRTIRVNPFFEFLYWNMNYHTEHHMYAGVPCYNLKQLHRAVAHEMPYCPRGLLETWTDIIRILRRQKQDPTYQFRAAVPPAASPPSPTPAAPQG